MVIAILDYPIATVKIIDIGDIEPEEYLYEVLGYSENNINWMEVDSIEMDIFTKKQDKTIIKM